MAKECEGYGGFYCEDDGTVQAIELGFKQSPCFEWCNLQITAHSSISKRKLQLRRKHEVFSSQFTTITTTFTLLVTGNFHVLALTLGLPATPKVESALLTLDCPIADLNVTEDCEQLGFYCDDNNKVQTTKSGHEESPCFDWCKCVADM
ncbi:hypothetical protein QBC36DRAFT_376606 [Triangularia setosa]|uniref:Uncharacterized protein n=1 Tax=Triangularia setosa TaxID=2587417 RepID=A0AAN6WCM8_9PEZI|nr:hypothetical protein QBC36DRAFT_376606 [Podospora setosa]